MINIVEKFFGKRGPDDSSNQGKQLSSNIHIATCALFLEMANVDGEFSVLEREHIIFILKRDFDLSEKHAAALIKASNKELKGSIDLWKFTHRINQYYSIGEKIRIVETIWRVVYADGKLDKHEDYLVHKLAHLLRLSHKQLIDAKLKAKQSMMDY